MTIKDKDKPTNDVPHYLFDGFMHRPYSEELDGHLKTRPVAADYPAVQLAMETLNLFDELRTAKYRIWELEKENKMMKEALHWK